LLPFSTPSDKLFRRNRIPLLSSRSQEGWRPAMV